jgi:hypothetical protein
MEIFSTRMNYKGAIEAMLSGISPEYIDSIRFPKGTLKPTKYGSYSVSFLFKMELRKRQKESLDKAKVNTIKHCSPLNKLV